MVARDHERRTDGIAADVLRRDSLSRLPRELLATAAELLPVTDLPSLMQGAVLGAFFFAAALLVASYLGQRR